MVPAGIENLMAAKEIVVCCGPGGVGKTTTAAAASAMAASSQGGRVLVLTVDPARRLADALGVATLGNTARRVPAAALRAAGVAPRGELWAAMLDTRQSWDDLVRRHAPDRATADRILANPLYQNVAGRFVQSHDYIAMERLYEIHLSGTFDLVVVDTPPSRNAIDLLEAPGRMAEFFASRLLRWLTVPARHRMIGLASRPFTQVADRVLGAQFLADITEFFLLFQSMYDGFVERSRAVERLLRDRRSTFVVVTTLGAAPVREAEYLLAALAERGLHAGALVLNKVLPDYFADAEPARAARRLKEDAAGLAEVVPPGIGETSAVARVLAEIGDSFLNFRVVATREAEQRAELARTPDTVVAVPYFDHDIADLPALMELGRTLYGGRSRGTVL